MTKKNLSETLIIIPARGGSKRLPRKNILPLAGKPLICWAIEAAINAKVKGRIIVTSDDKEILSIASQYESQGVTFHRRPDALATDEATTADVVLDVINSEESKGMYATTVVLLQPTSPLRIANDIEGAVACYYNSGSKHTVVTVCEVDHPTAWVGTLSESSELEGIALSNKRSQDYLKEYRLNGAVYVVPVSTVKYANTLFTPVVLASVMPRERSLDIDEAVDFAIAETMVKYSSKRSGAEAGCA
ncbi:acylneuraminate cytidylyltransferase family protein [Halomonas sp. NCCP-2165]|nr:acylneuraminate cytidylyltransferase family protein [Halomonas sp. NCCP-2165]GKW49729.1 hypothetical protein NCCP2165_19440 [Halomonas sp. NCCP-2165]